MLSKEEAALAFKRKLASSGLNLEDGKALGFRVFTAEELPPKLEVQYPAAGFLLPYHTLTGKVNGFHRFRYLEQPQYKGLGALVPHKELRYTQPPGLTPHVYFSPQMNWQDHFSTTDKERHWVMITEGELKAACACKLGYPTLALGGVWNFMSSRDGIPLIEDLAALPLEDYSVYIVYDSDAVSNPDVLRAENAIAQQLLAHGAHVWILRLPDLEKGKKTGLDDYLQHPKGGKKRFEALFEKSEEWAGSSALHALNEEVILLRASCDVLEFRTRHRWNRHNFVSAAYSDRTYTVSTKNDKGESKIKEYRTAEEWMKWPGRAVVERATYAPGEPLVVNGEYNCWRGWGVAPEYIKEGSVALWDKLMRLVFNGPDRVHRAWFERWLAYPLQHPGAKLATAVMMFGVQQGTGKTLIGHTMGQIYGENFSELKPLEMGSSHNEWALYKQLVLCDEITGEDSSGKRFVSMDTLKGLLTQRQFYFNPKYISAFYMPDTLNYYFTSNHPDALRMEDSDRRFAVFDVSVPDLATQTDFYREYDHWYKSKEGIGALFYYFLNLDLGDFNPYAHAPVTNAKGAMIEDVRGDLGGWVAALRENPTALFAKSPVTSPALAARRLWTTAELYSLYPPGTRVTENGLARELKRAGFKKALYGSPVNIGDQRVAKLWIIQDREALSKLKNPKQFTREYFKDRPGERPPKRRRHNENPR